MQGWVASAGCPPPKQKSWLRRCRKNEGSPRQGLLKNRAKARFKGAMRFIRRNEDALRKESLAQTPLCKNDKAFWKEIKLMNNSNLSLPNVVDGITGSNNIVNNKNVEISLLIV